MALRVAALGSVLSLVVFVLMVNVTQVHCVGLARNLSDGAVTVLSPGIHVTAPWVQVVNIDTRPQKVCTTSSAKSYSCKLVQFEPQYAEQFVATQGFGYYWWNNRLSFNSGYSEEYRGMRDVLRGYAFGNKPYNFITTLQTEGENP